MLVQMMMSGYNFPGFKLLTEGSAGLTHKRTKRTLRAPSCKGAPSKTGQKLIK